MAKIPASRGRPPSVSRELLQDAAFELFLEQGYENTPVEHIAHRAGVGRSTFFNHFAAKSDVFWIELDDALALLEAGLADTAPDAFDVVRRALFAVADRFGPDTVPFVLTQYDLIGSVGELQATAVTRLAHHASLITRRLESSEYPRDVSRAIAFALVAASVSAARSWASAGTSRGALTPYLQAVVDPILDGFAAIRRSKPL